MKTLPHTRRAPRRKTNKPAAVAAKSLDQILHGIAADREAGPWGEWAKKLLDVRDVKKC